MFRYICVLAILGYIIGWVAYLELSPSMGNVWWRINTLGVKEFTPWGIWATAIAPFKQGHGLFWTPAFWDVNPWPALGIIVFIIMYWKHLYEKGEVNEESTRHLYENGGIKGES